MSRTRTQDEYADTMVNTPRATVRSTYRFRARNQLEDKKNSEMR